MSLFCKPFIARAVNGACRQKLVPSIRGHRVTEEQGTIERRWCPMVVIEAGPHPDHKSLGVFMDHLVPFKAGMQALPSQNFQHRLQGASGGEILNCRKYLAEASG